MDARGRRRVGQVFVVSGVALVVIATLVGLGVVPVGQPVSSILAAVLGAAGAVEGVIGLRLLGKS